MSSQVVSVTDGSFAIPLAVIAPPAGHIKPISIKARMISVYGIELKRHFARPAFPFLLMMDQFVNAQRFFRFVRFVAQIATERALFRMSKCVFSHDRLLLETFIAQLAFKRSLF